MTTQIRTRTANKDDEIEINSYFHTYGGPYPVDTVVSRSLKRMDDVVTHNFHMRIAKGEVINNPMLYEVDTVKVLGRGKATMIKIDDPSWIAERSGGSLTYALYNIAEAGFNPWGWDDSLVSPYSHEEQLERCKQFALADVDSTPHEFGEDLGEIRETIEFLKSPLRSIRNLTEVFNRKSSRVRANPLLDARQRAEAIADLWSTYSFAAAPLLRSVMDALEAYNASKTDSEPRKRRNARGFASFSDASLYEGIEKTVPYHVTTHDEGYRIDDLYKATILYEVSNPLEDWKFQLGLRVKDIPSTTWQLLPLSFMVDRLYNISNVIKGAINFLDPQLSFLAASVTRRTTKYSSFTVTDQVNQTWLTALTPDTWTRSRFRYERTVWNPRPIDVLTTSLDVRGLVNSISKTADLIALIVLALRGKGPYTLPS